MSRQQSLPHVGARRLVYGGLPWVWVLSLLVGPPLAAQADITSNLVGYWALDAGTGTTAIDSSTSNITLTLANGPTWALPGKVGAAAVSFVAANSQALEVPIETTSPLWPNTGDFTVAAWIKLAATGAEHGIAGTWSSSGALWYMRVNNTGTLLWVMTDVDTASITVFGTGTITDTTTWHHVAASVVRASNVTFYIDGTAAGSGSVTTVAGSVNKATTTWFNVGAIGSTAIQFATATLDDVRIYARALTVGDVGALIALGGAAGPRRSPLWRGAAPRPFPHAVATRASARAR